MASGRSHSIASLTAATCFAVTAIYTVNPALLWTAAGAFVGVALTPDLDHDDGTLSEYFMRGISDKLQRVWWAYWCPYRKLISHRSFFSHFPIVGTIIRVMYLFWWLYLAGHPLPPAFINGLVAVDFLHWSMDWRLFRRIFIQ